MALPPRKGAAREESILPKAPRRCLPLLGLSLFLISWRMGLLGLVPLAHIGQRAPPTAHVPPRGRWPHPVDPRDPSGGPGTIPVNPDTFSVAETGLPIYNSSPPDHSGTPRDVGSHPGLRTTFGFPHTYISTTLASPNLKCVDPTGLGDMQT